MNQYGAFILLAMVIFVVIWSVYQRLQHSRRVRQQIRAAWGKPRAADYSLKDIALYHTMLNQKAADAPDTYPKKATLDDRTWNDLHLDSIFRRLDHAQSIVGKQCLYHFLREPCSEEGPLRLRDERASYFAANAPLRERLQIMLEALNNGDAAFIPFLFLGELPSRTQMFFMFPLLTLSACGCLIGAFFHPILLLGLAPITLVNVVVAPAYRLQIAEWVRPLRVLSALLGMGRRMQALADAENSSILHACLEPFREHQPSLSWLNRLTPYLVFEQAGSSDVSQILYGYLNMLLLTDVNIFVFSLEMIRRNRAAIRGLYEAIGNIDAMISLASFRHGLPFYARPIFTPQVKALQMEGVVHPLLLDPVPNSLRVSKAGVFVTGSNMSGKTTFIRAVAVNAVFAQTLYTCLAQHYEAPFVRVQTCIDRSDSLEQGKSYYMTEVERIGGFLADASKGPQYLFAIDEIYRGTNTTERVAAAKAVLDALNADHLRHFVLVSTHDTELSGLLQTTWSRFHFREFVQDAGLNFDYRMRSGLSSTRNALLLLQEAGYPTAVVADARATAERLSAG